MTTHLWTWDGQYFGYREGNDLWTRGGVLAGQFHGSDIYGLHGTYIGELNGDRLLTDITKSALHQAPFGPRHGAAAGSHGPLGTRGMLGGYTAFPRPETFK